MGEVVGEWMKDTRYTENFYTRYTNTVSSHPTPHPTPNSSKFKARVEEHALNKRISLLYKNVQTSTPNICGLHSNCLHFILCRCPCRSHRIWNSNNVPSRILLNPERSCDALSHQGCENKRPNQICHSHTRSNITLCERQLAATVYVGKRGHPVGDKGIVR